MLFGFQDSRILGFQDSIPSQQGSGLAYRMGFFSFFLEELEFSILELGLFWAQSCGELAGWGLVYCCGARRWSDFDC